MAGFLGSRFLFGAELSREERFLLGSVGTVGGGVRFGYRTQT